MLRKHFSIQELESMKAECTPGPWKFREHSDYEYPAGPEWGAMQTELDHAVLDAEDTYLFGSCNDYKLIEHPGNLPLAASAPDLVDALIAEKQAHAELRKRIEERIRELKQPLCSHVLEGDELDDYLEQWDRQFYEAAVLTEILEGNA